MLLKNQIKHITVLKYSVFIYFLLISCSGKTSKQTYNAFGTSLYNGVVKFNAFKDSTGNFVLRDTIRNIVTLNLNHSTDFKDAVDFVSNSNNFSDTIYNAGISGHWGAQAVYDYYLVKFGRKGLNDKHGKLTQYVHYGNEYFNAMFDKDHVVYGDGGAYESTPIISLDYVGHELTHGVTASSSGLVYKGESGALNESYSDIFAKCIEYYKTPKRASWLVFPDIYIPKGRATRSMSHPKEGFFKKQPNTYKGQYWSAAGDVHVNSGVQNYWFYLLVNGGSGSNDKGYDYKVSGIGIEKAEQIVYRTLTIYTQANANFYDTRLASERAATDLFGKESQELAMVIDAWLAVGVNKESAYEPSIEKEFIDFVVTNNANGSLKRKTGVTLTEFPGSKQNNSTNQQKSEMTWVLLGPSSITDYETFKSYQNWEHISFSIFEIRFTSSQNKALFTKENRSSGYIMGNVPFELWNLKNTANDYSDDVRMIPVIADVDGNRTYGLVTEDKFPWGYSLDHPAVKGETNFWTDPIHWDMPKDTTSGDIGYKKFIKQGEVALGDNFFQWVSFVQNNAKSDTKLPGKSKYQYPENGTVIRIITSGRMLKPRESVRPTSKPVENEVVIKIIKQLK